MSTLNPTTRLFLGLAALSLSLSAAPAPVSPKTTSDSTTTAIKSAPSSPDTLSYPSVVLNSDSLRVVVYTPDAKKGYYRGPRFNWSGMIGRVEFKGHTFYADWATPHDPVNPEHGIGPAEEFGMDNALGYDSVPINGLFVKIGVGRLVKPAKVTKYFFNYPFEVKEPGTWAVTWQKSSVSFAQQMTGDRGWGYSYTKKITVAGSAMTIAHTLKNTGTRPIATQQYSHNFTSIDGGQIDSSYRLTFGFTPAMSPDIAKNFGDHATLTGRVLQIKRLLDGKTLWASFGGLTGVAGENHVVVENTRTRASVTIDGSAIPAKYEFYATKTVVCPEPFVAVNVEPGKSLAWSTALTFRAER